MTNLGNRFCITLLTLITMIFVVRELDYQQALRSRVPDVTVYVTGEVNRPGAVTLPASARRMHAFTVSGGLTEVADLEELEPARALVDGETILVPKICERPEPPPTQFSREAEPTESRNHTEKIDINRASERELQQIPGVGPVLARRIVEKRNSQPSGTFVSIEDLTTIRGIKRKTMARLEPYLELEAYDR